MQLKHEKFKLKNLKLIRLEKKNKEINNLRKTNSLKIIGKIINENSYKKHHITNELIENANNKNNKKILKSIKKKDINNLENKNYNNITDLGKNNSLGYNFNPDKIKPKKKIKSIYSLNILNLNRTKSNYFPNKLSPNIFGNKFNINIRKRKNIFLYTKHYGNNNKCPLCQSMDMKAKYSENKIGLYKKYNKSRTENAKTSLNNNTFIKTNLFPYIKEKEDKKYNNIFSIKREFSPISSNINKNNYFIKVKEQFKFDILRKKEKNEKLGIIDFPILDKYFNS